MAFQALLNAARPLACCLLRVSKARLAWDRLSALEVQSNNNTTPERAALIPIPSVQESQELRPFSWLFVGGVTPSLRQAGFVC